MTYLRKLPLVCAAFSILSASCSVVSTAPAALDEVPCPEWGIAKTASYDEILDKDNQGSKQTEMFRFEENPTIYILDFGSYSGGERGLEHQGKVMNRLSVYIEKEGAPRDRVLTDGELEQFILDTGRNSESFSIGRDYRAYDLARFFNQCQKQSVGNEEELKLRSALVENGFIKKNGKGLYEPVSTKALISFPEEQSDNRDTPQREGINLWHRKATLGHELGHGEYFTNEDYRNYCRTFWHENMSQSDRKAFLDFLDRSGYDSMNKELVINEIQAGLFHTPFIWFSPAIDIPLERLEELRKEFLSENAIGSFCR